MQLRTRPKSALSAAPLRWSSGSSVNMGVSPNIFTVEDWSALAAATLRGQARGGYG